MATLYHYLHCPFCIRVRLSLGFLKLPYHSRPLDYDDEKTPKALIGQKMLPIWQETEGEAIGESLDIILKLDTENRLATRDFYSSSERRELDAFLGEISRFIHPLTMPAWIYTKEFTASARDYFQKKKEEKYGPFGDLVKNKNKYLEGLEPLLHKIEKELIPYYQSSNLGIKDIMIAAHVWGLYLVPEFQFSPALHSYLQNVKSQCNFNYMDDLWF